MSLQSIFEQHNDRFSGKWKHYFEIYDRHISRYIGKDVTLLEIGTSNGGSLQVWKKFLGPNSKIVGIDIDVRTSFTEDQIETYIGNQNDPNFLMNVLNRIGRPDIIIDDGSHDQMDVMNSFSILFQHVKDDGVYIIEDLHTAYMQDYHGGITSPLNFVSIASRFAHDVNLQWISQPYQPVVRNLKSMSFYDSMLVLEKEVETKKEPAYAGSKKIDD